MSVAIADSITVLKIVLKRWQFIGQNKERLRVLELTFN